MMRVFGFGGGFVGRLVGVWVLATGVPRAVRSGGPLLIACAVLGLGSLGAAAPALAVSEFGGEGEGAGQFTLPAGLAVSQESSDVYLVDRNNTRVERWAGSGAFVSGWGWGVRDGATSAFLRCEATCFAGLAGAGAGEFGELPAGVAVDNSLGLSHGAVYVADSQNFRVQKFTAAGEFELMFGGEVNETKDNTLGATPAEKNVCPVAPGDVCKAGVASGAAGAFEDLGANPLAVDSSGTVYVGDRDRIQKFSGSGAAEGAVRAHDLVCEGIWRVV